MGCFVPGPVTVTVPATSANLGPGYDALGLALSLRDTITAEVVEGPDQIVAHGEGASSVPTDRMHLVVRSMDLAFDQMGVPRPSLRVDCTNVIPHGRGLGSSSAAIVAGVHAARSLVADASLRLGDEDAFALAAEIEGHPDNVAPAFWGGFTLAWAEAGRFRSVRCPVDLGLRLVALVPSAPVPTSLARGLLPAQVAHTDAASNLGRAALMVLALGGRHDLLLPASYDRLHQRHRRPAMPASIDLVEALRADGLAAVVSGAGPTVLVLGGHPAGGDETEELTPRVMGVLGRGADQWLRVSLAVEEAGVRTEA